jgi:DNA adenine methylase
MLPPSERRELHDHEQVIEAAQRYRLLEAKALKAIRDGRLYRGEDATFEDYCKRRWGFGSAQGKRLCAWAEVASNLAPIGAVLPTRESHARPLAKLTVAQQRRAWAIYLKNSPTSHHAADIERVCRTVHRMPVSDGEFDRESDGDGGSAADQSVVSPLAWYGSKAKLASTIASLIPAHFRYVEIFAGSAAVLFRKEPSRIEIINDLDGDVVHLYRILRDKGQAAELARLLALTPYSRQEHDWCVENPESSDPVERARRFFVRCRQSYAGIVDDAWSFSLTSNRASDFASPVRQIEHITRRLSTVQVENKDFRSLLGKVDLPDTVIFADPPYLPSVRTNKAHEFVSRYRHELSGDDHVDLLERVTGLRRAKVLMCGYASPLYQQYLGGWRRYEFESGVRASKVETGTLRPARRTEVVWANF